jgi:hypothetical protein
LKKDFRVARLAYYTTTKYIRAIPSLHKEKKVWLGTSSAGRVRSEYSTESISNGRGFLLTSKTHESREVPARALGLCWFSSPLGIVSNYPKSLHKAKGVFQGQWSTIPTFQQLLSSEENSVCIASITVAKWRKDNEVRMPARLLGTVQEDDWTLIEEEEYFHDPGMQGGVCLDWTDQISVWSIFVLVEWEDGKCERGGQYILR